MEPILFFSAVLKLFYALAALLLVWWTLRLLAKSTDRNVRAALDKIEADPLATAVYMGLRILAVCILVAAAIN